MEKIKFTKRNKNKVSDALDGKVSFRKLTAEEWHQYVQNYNYDDGVLESSDSIAIYSLPDINKRSD